MQVALVGPVETNTFLDIAAAGGKLSHDERHHSAQKMRLDQGIDVVGVVRQSQALVGNLARLALIPADEVKRREAPQRPEQLGVNALAVSAAAQPFTGISA